MKNLLFALLVFVSISISAQTTQEEYNYVTKGLKTQYANGLDIKKGYTLELYEKMNVEKDLNIIYYLLKNDKNKISAIVLVYGSDIASPTAAIFCIPTASSEQTIWGQYFERFNDAKTPKFITLILRSNSVMLSKALTGNQQ